MAHLRSYQAEKQGVVNPPRQQVWIDQYNEANPFTTSYLQDQQNLYNQQYADWERNNPVPIQTQWDYWTEQVPIAQKAFKDAGDALSNYQRSPGQGPGWAGSRLPWNHPLKQAVSTAWNNLNIAYDRRKYWGNTDPSTTPERAPPPEPLSTNITGRRRAGGTLHGVLDPDDRPDWEKFSDIAFDKRGRPVGWNTPMLKFDPDEARKAGIDPDFEYRKSYSTRYQQPDKSYFTRVIGDVPESVMDEWYEHQWDAQQEFWQKFSERSGRVKGKTFLPGGGTISDAFEPESGPSSPFDFGAENWERRKQEIERERDWGVKWRTEFPDWPDESSVPWPQGGFGNPPPYLPPGRYRFGGTQSSGGTDLSDNGDVTDDPVEDNENIIRNSNKPRVTSQTFR